MSAALISALATGIAGIIGAITALIVAIKANGKATSAIASKSSQKPEA